MKDCVGFVLLFVIGAFLGICCSFGFISFLTLNDDNTPCNCTIDYNGSKVSIEDTINLLQEALSADQADEVQIMINKSMER